MKRGVYEQLAPILFGSGTVVQVGDKAKELGMTKVLVVTDKGIAAVGHPKKVVDSLKAAGIECKVWAEATGDCPTESVRAGSAVAREFGADGIVGIGGGSSLDTAKAIASIAANTDEILEQIPVYLSGQKSYPNAPLKSICIPTTAGTGSECTRVAVLNDEKLDMKIGLPAFPSLGIVDPELTVGSPASLTAFCGMDAFAHANECLASKLRTPHSELLGYEAIRLITKWLPVACADTKNLEARENLSLASNLAGISFSEGDIHLGHVIAHELGHKYNIPHGLGGAVATPAIIEFVALEYPETTKKIGDAMGLDLTGVTDAAVGREVADAVREMMLEINIPTLEEKGIQYYQVMEMLPAVMNHPLAASYDGTFTEDQVKRILEQTYYWKSKSSNQ
ncbi:iron-containing alcohol dehydrogenase [Paenibacillus puldeungensis]|uniref:Iron-containing alcohol dehydrogenase n=1 Tax=Paenibacillus puldeungensis TaxID=696536 RepID=A0ABW3RQV6_9BACL